VEHPAIKSAKSRIPESRRNAVFFRTSSHPLVLLSEGGRRARDLAAQPP